MNIPAELRYTQTHEWVRVEGDLVVVGITDHAQDAMGDITFVDLPAPDDDVTAAESFGGVESVKTFSDVYAPVDGTVASVNEALEDAPELVNEDPYTGGWLLKIRPASLSDVDALMDAEAYEAFLHKD
jgi:glycine cleavage system H protein